MPAQTEARQFRKAVMTLPNATVDDLNLLRQVIGLAQSSSIVKFIAFSQLSEDSHDYQVLAYAKNKLSPACWRGAVHKRLESITPIDDLKPLIAQAKTKPMFEQHGTFKTCKPATIPPAQKAIQVKPTTTSEPSEYIQRLIGHIVPRNGYLVARKTYLRIMGFSVPDDFDTSVERAREIEQLLAQPKQPETTTTTTVVVSNKPSAASTKRGPPRKFVRKFKYAPAAEAGSAPH